MSSAKTLYNQLTTQLCELDPNIHPGKMMSAEGLKYKDKVFLFFYKDDHMVFKLGKNFDLTEAGSSTIKPFNPFKNKGPLAGWFQVGYEEKELWEPLGRMALEVLQVVLVR